MVGVVGAVAKTLVAFFWSRSQAGAVDRRREAA